MSKIKEQKAFTTKQLGIFEFLDVKFTQASVAQGKTDGFDLYLHGRTQAVHKLLGWLRAIHTAIQIPTLLVLWLGYKLHIVKAPQIPQEVLDLKKAREEAIAKARLAQANGIQPPTTPPAA